MAKIQARRSTRTAETSDRPLTPMWRCYCCQDTGLVANEFLSDYVEDPDEQTSPFICQKSGCEKGALFLAAFYASDSDRAEYTKVKAIPVMRQADYQACFDVRLPQWACEEMHEKSVRRWQLWAQKKHDRSIDINQISHDLSLA